MPRSHAGRGSTAGGAVPMRVGRKLRRATPCVAAGCQTRPGIRDLHGLSRINISGPIQMWAEGVPVGIGWKATRWMHHSSWVPRAFHDRRAQYVTAMASLNPIFWNVDHAPGVMQFNGSRQPASSLSEKSEYSLLQPYLIAIFAPSERACVAGDLRHRPT